MKTAKDSNDIMKTLKKFITTSKNVEKSGALWNMIASIFISFQQELFAIVMTHVLPKSQAQIMAGIFSVGYANANLFLCIGKYGMRFFQVSDVDREYNFQEYRVGRIITTILMTVTSIVYIIVVSNLYGYTINKSMIILWICLLKVPDAFEDVFFGEYQKNERLDVASKMWALRYILTIIVMVVMIVVTKDLLLTLIVSTIFTAVLMMVFLLMTKEFISERKTLDMKMVWKQLWVTFPLALGGFLTFYIGVAPRNAIDAIIGDETLQAIYNYLVMPVFVVQMMVTFVFNPKAYYISCLWNDRKMSEYLKETLKQVAFVVAITLICIAGAAILGVPVLSVLFNCDLAPYKTDLLIMLIGSGCLGLATLLANLLTVMRYQNAILVGYAITALVAFLFSNQAVAAYGIRGAVVFYVGILFLQSMIFVVEFIYGVLRNRNQKADSKDK